MSKMPSSAVRFRFISLTCSQRVLFFLIGVCCLLFVMIGIILVSGDNDKRLSTAETAFSSGAVEFEGRLRHAANPSDNAKPEFQFPKAGKFAGKLNLHVWNICGFDVSNIREWPLFPCLPNQRNFVMNFSSKILDGGHVGQRIFGFLHPPSTGKYNFAITSDDTSELWLSPNGDPTQVRFIAGVYDNKTHAWTQPGEYNKYPTQISREIYLSSDQRYFIESLHKNAGREGHVEVLWKAPGKEQFSMITEQFLKPFCADTNEERCGLCINDELKETLRIPSHSKQTLPAFVTEEVLQYYYNTAAFEQQHLRDVLPVVSYKPSYVVKDGFVRKNSGIWQSNRHIMFLFPEDAVQINEGIDLKSSPRCFRPNEVLPKEDAEQIVSQFVSALQGQNGKRFSLEQIIRVEGKKDKKKGVRYFLELKLRDTRKHKSVRLAEYVFSDFEGHLGFPEGLKWRRDTAIHFILPVKNQARWVQYFLIEMTKLYKRTGDGNFHLIIIDFESTDDDISRILQTSPLALKCTLLKETGEFHKTMAIQDAVNTVKDPDSIVFLFDLHITVPITLLDSIRKHTIQNKTVFLPIVARLQCGVSPAKPKGKWEMIGSGIVSVYKSDWDRFHGMDVEKFRTKWGGEDWDLLDRILRVGLEAERYKIPGFYHFFHTKSGMWDRGKNKTLAAKNPVH